MPVMSKLVVAIVQESDSDRVAEALQREGFRFTIIPSRGGFLGNPNSTFLMGIEDERLASAMAIFAASATAREVELPLVLLERLSDWRARTVHHGGATVLVGDLEQILRM